MEDFYRVKRVKYKDRNTAICLQNENGPCPLLAIVNCLLLRASIDIHADISYISYQQLAELLTDYLFQTQSSAAQDPNLEQIVLDVVGVIPRLRTGIDVNIRFRSCDSFEYTVELAAFDAFRVRLLHGWIIDPNDDSLVSTIDNLSYNQLVDFLVTSDDEGKPQQESTPTTSQCTREEEKEKRDEEKTDCTPTSDMAAEQSPAPSTEENIRLSDTNTEATQETEEPKTETSTTIDPGDAGHSSDQVQSNTSAQQEEEQAAAAATAPSQVPSPKTKAAIIRQFLAETSSQLTMWGLEELHKLVQEDELCVFFRNNHFSTMTKHLGNLYLLISDIGFAEEKDVIWEKIVSIDGDSEFVNADFEPIQRGESLAAVTSPSGKSLDEQLAAQLQAEENRRQATASSLSPPTTNVSHKETAKQLSSSPSRNSPVTKKKNTSSHMLHKNNKDAGKKSSCSIQ
jgi:hypothetical protein